MPENTPTHEDIEKLLAYLPLFDRPGRQFVKQWDGGEKLSDGAITMPYPVYEEDVDEFFQLASQSCWMNQNYNPATAGKMLEDKQFISKADIQYIQIMLTYCVRGERFCDGHWGAVLKSGQVVALLKRLQQMQKQDENI